MRARMPISIFLTIALTLSQTPTQSATPPKAGTVCTKAGSSKIFQGKKYLCIKSGKKLVWNKGKKVLQAQTDAKSRYKEALQVQAYIDLAMTNSSSSQPKINWYFQPTLSTKTIDGTKLGLENAITLYNKLGFTTNETTVFVAENESTLRSLIRTADCSLDQYNSAWGFISFNSCPNNRVILTARSFSSLKLGTYIEDFEYQHVLAHEYAHQLQFELHGRTPTRIPTWMIEGGAQFLTSVAYASWNQNRNYEDHLFYITAIWRSDTWLPCIKVRVQDVPLSGSYDERKCGYSKGAKAVEFLVSKYGFKGYMDILRNSSSNSFESAFQMATGDNLQSFYEQLDVFLKSQGWN